MALKGGGLRQDDPVRLAGVAVLAEAVRLHKRGTAQGPSPLEPGSGCSPSIPALQLWRSTVLGAPKCRFLDGVESDAKP